MLTDTDNNIRDSTEETVLLDSFSLSAFVCLVKHKIMKLLQDVIRFVYQPSRMFLQLKYFHYLLHAALV